MSCNCATTEQINELYRQFGEKRKKAKKFSLKTVTKRVLIAVCTILLVPVIFIYAYYKAFCSDDNKISVNKFFNLKPQNQLTNVG